ncbi:hypothetical protein HanXRQr2_Chr11g0485571 [Helianthus annuus]|uniref:Uncharacterized protein n=1 Tax=Helianthus annuus TaxID=4232 RepID=A0A9K3N045_HELAN|nr:hypothetical protein HanXRQr2_Chr11g0485571 [Helianthus annuus]KAJ0874708.1 hypothetical protein HanPSC8_Chr11g0467401 [Helianthus annuus]
MVVHLYAIVGNPCVAAESTTRHDIRQSSGSEVMISWEVVVQPSQELARCDRV